MGCESTEPQKCLFQQPGASIYNCIYAIWNKCASKCYLVVPICTRRPHYLQRATRNRTILILYEELHVVFGSRWVLYSITSVKTIVWRWFNIYSLGRNGTIHWYYLHLCQRPFPVAVPWSDASLPLLFHLRYFAGVAWYNVM